MTTVNIDNLTLSGAPHWQHRGFILKVLTGNVELFCLSWLWVCWFWEATLYLFLLTRVFSWNRKLWNKGHCRLPCMLLLCVCWWKWCDVDPTMLLLLLELVELLSGLGVAIVVLGFRQQRSGCNAEWNFALSASRRDTAPLERSSCTRDTSVPLLPSNPVGNIVNHGFAA